MEPSQETKRQVAPSEAVLPERPSAALRHSMQWNLRQLTEPEIDLAASFAAREWGKDDGVQFAAEIRRYIQEPGSAVYGAFSKVDERLAGAICIAKLPHSYDLWGMTWLIVDKEQRGKGAGVALIQACVDHALAQREKFPSKHCLLTLTTSRPAFYERLGFTTIDKWGEGPTCHMRRQLY